MLRTMRVGTWNLDRPTASQNERGESLTSWLRKVNADVWVLTYTHSAITPGEEFGLVATSAPPGAPGEFWTAIWSRFPISAFTISCDPSRAVVARIEPPGRRPIVVYGTVLPWLGSAWSDASAAKGAAFAAALEAQTRDWKRIRANNCECDLIVAGDMNQDLVGKPHFYGSRENRLALDAAFTACGLTCLTSGLDDPVRLGGARAHAAIDHLCASERLAAQARWPRFSWPPGPIPDKTLTDHFGTAAA
jgi:hypothetical protein